MEENKKFKISKKIKVLMLLPVIILSIYFTFFTAIEKIHKVKNSVNPEATNYYVHATTVSVFIFALHDYVFLDFDNPIFKPLYKLRDYFFEKGESLIPNDNSENIVWWDQNYSTIYGSVASDRRDETMTIDKLDKDNQLKLRERIYNYLLKFSEYPVKGDMFSHKIDIRDTLITLSGVYNDSIFDLYDGKNVERTRNFAQDPIQQERYPKIYEAINKIDYDDPIFKFSKYYILEKKTMIEIFKDKLNTQLCYREDINSYINSLMETYTLALNLQNSNSVGVRNSARNFIEVRGPEVKGAMFHFVLNSMGENCPSDSIVYKKILKIKKELNNGNK